MILSDRGSKYAVSGGRVADRAAIDAALRDLKRDKKYAKATHNSWGVLLDGLIIVTRWYGGKHLGGDRFRHVQEATRLYLDHPAP